MKELERKISVIIPCYNAEETIEETLNSIIKANYSNKEIIIVDNESKDNSRKIINKYVKKYDYIKLYKSKSYLCGGVKNLAIKKCTGDYFIVVDDDDYVEPNIFKRINEVIKKKDYDLIRYNAYFYDESNKNMFITNIKEGSYTSNEYLEYILKEFIKENKIFGPSWLYAYNKKFYDNNKFKFKNKFQEDYGLTPTIIIKSKSIYVLEDILYNYTYSPEGMTNKLDHHYQKALDVLYFSEKHLQNIKYINIKNKELYKKYIIETLFRKYKKLNKEYKEDYLKKIKGSDLLEKYLNISNYTDL